MTKWFDKQTIPEMFKEDDCVFGVKSKPVLGFLKEGIKLVVFARKYDDDDTIDWWSDCSEQWLVNSSLLYWCELPADPV